MRLPVSALAARRSPEERRRYREERFRRYFQRARRIILPWQRLGWEGLPWGRGEVLAADDRRRLGRRLGAQVLYGEARDRRLVLLVAEPPGSHPEPPQEIQIHWLTWSGHHWRLVGLLDGARRTLALGLILPGPWDPGGLALWTPLAPEAAARVRFLKAGKMRVNLRGQELTHV